MQNQLDNVLQAMRDALEKLERAVQLPSRKEFESMSARVADLSRRLDEIERNAPAKKAAARKPAPKKKRK